MIDDRGNVYEGRYGGEGVVGGHARAYNWGSVGIALLGDYSRAAPSPAALAALAELMAWKGNLHFIHPLREGDFIDKILPNIMAHRDCQPQTTCPGNGLYALLPSIRQQVMARMQQIPPNGEFLEPAQDALVRSVQPVSVRGSPAVALLELHVDGVLRASSTSNPFLWKWNTTLESDGLHQLKLVAITAAGRSHEQVIGVRVDNTPPVGGVSLPPFVNSRDVSLGAQATGADRMQWSFGWLWEGEDLYHQIGTGHLVSDTAALNGRAWHGRAGLDRAGFWYGPYLCGLPLGRDYWPYFRLKVVENSSASQVARLDVVDKEGQRIHQERSLECRDFPLAGRYTEFPLPFSYVSYGGTCQNVGVDDGLEFRTWFSSQADLYLDRVQLFTAPEPYSPSLALTLPEGEGRKEIAVRYLDQAGNPSAVYTATTLLDMTPPVWLGGGGSGYALVRDSLSGLDVSSAQYARSGDGQTWDDWLPARIDAFQGATGPVLVYGDADGACFIRFRLGDRAGNLSTSPPYALACAATATPTTAEPGATGTPTATQTRVVPPWLLPLILRGRQEVSPPTATPSPTPTLFTTIIVRGTIYDASIGYTAPLSDAHVIVAIPAIGQQAEAYTRAGGEYQVEFRVPSHPSGAAVSVVAERQHYAPGWSRGALGSYIPGGVQEVLLDVGLRPLSLPTPTATTTPAPSPSVTPTLVTAIYVYGNTYDAQIGPTFVISGADLAIYLPGYQATATSDQAGRYAARFGVTGNLSGQRVDVVASKAGYAPGINYGLVPVHSPGVIVFVNVNVGLSRQPTPATRR